jgi:putative transposase
VTIERGKLRTIRIPPRSPQANAFAESFIGTLKKECLNYFVCFSQRQLNYILQTWVKYYNTERPHRGRGVENNVLAPGFHAKGEGRVRSKEQLGGVIRSYYRDVA